MAINAALVNVNLDAFGWVGCFGKLIYDKIYGHDRDALQGRDASGNLGCHILRILRTTSTRTRAAHLTCCLAQTGESKARLSIHAATVHTCPTNPRALRNPLVPTSSETGVRGREPSD